jgi:hypothetical protein
VQQPSLKLEETIRELMARGELVGFSCHAGIGGKYKASFTMSSKFGQSLSEDADPIKALMMAFTSAKMKRAAPTRREELGAEAKANGVIEQPVVEVEDDVSDLM